MQADPHHSKPQELDSQSPGEKHANEYNLPTLPSGSHAEAAKGRQQKTIARAVWLRTPLKDDGGLWVDPEHYASEWLSLFYDLAVVAVLTVFSTAYELDDPGRILPFFSYFIIIYWLWASQTLYDTKYQSDDIFHLVFKLLQICVFIYMGAASSNWSPGQLIYWGDEGVDAVDVEGVQDLISTSFKVVVWAYVASRVILGVQYATCGIHGRRCGRKTGHLFVAVGANLVSIGICMGAIFVPLQPISAAITKIALFYLAIAFEMVALGVQTFRSRRDASIGHHVIERYAALTLIILGEGFISLTKVFKRTLSGLSIRDFSSYAQVFMAVIIIFLCWGFLFSRFSKEDKVSRRRQHVWEVIHLPLAFGLLLFMAALANTVLTISAVNGLLLVTDIYVDVLTEAQTNVTQISKRSQYDIWRYMYRLDLDPPFRTQVNIINNAFDQANDTSTANPNIEFLKYFGQIVHNTLDLYEIELPDDVEHSYAVLKNISSKAVDTATANLNLQHAYETVTEMLNESISHMLSGSLWLLPSAGMVLLVITFRSMIWNRYRGIGHWIIHGFQLLASIALSLLGLLAKGSHHVRVDLSVDADDSLNTAAEGRPGEILAPLYDIVVMGLPLVIVMGVYLIAYVGSGALMLLIHWRRKRGVYGSDV